MAIRIEPGEVGPEGTLRVLCIVFRTRAVIVKTEDSGMNDCIGPNMDSKSIDASKLAMRIADQQKARFLVCYRSIMLMSAEADRTACSIRAISSSKRVLKCLSRFRADSLPLF